MPLKKNTVVNIQAWLENPEGEANGLGEKALRDIVKQARQVGHLVSDPKIIQLSDQIEKQISKLSRFRAKGLVRLSLEVLKFFFVLSGISPISICYIRLLHSNRLRMKTISGICIYKENVQLNHFGFFVDVVVPFQGNAPEALELAKQISKNLDDLSVLVDPAISREVSAGTRLPAATTCGQYEQALCWIEDPRSAEDVIG